MKAMKQLTSLSQGELIVRLEDFKKELLKHRVKASTGVNAANVGKLRQAKKNIARVQSLLGRREG